MESLANLSRSRGRPRAGQQTKEVKRYQLVIPNSMYDVIKEIADTENSTVLETIRRLIRYGLTLYTILKDRENQLIIRNGNVEREVVLG